MTAREIPTVEHLTLRTVSTRAKLVAIAERLFAERGIDNIALSDINKAAGQRNKSAAQYHFGSKDGLLQAILDKHAPGIVARRNAILDELEARAKPTMRDVVGALLYPIAEKIADPDGGKAFIRIHAQLVATHLMSIHNLCTSSLQLRQVDRLTRALSAAIGDLPEVIAQQRLMLAAILLFHGLADHSRMQDASGDTNPVVHNTLFIQNLEDCLVALLTADVSHAAIETLSAIHTRSSAMS
ncbi:TetR/AcrR family transcriptional regulator [Paraburkholderia silviterrae]|uniref:TetR/AcrR family transcriptional regulator n=1 Tax=Paraburkholderia silviterrae TaxID=2528715 RepID=A0A4R5M332_9BURK|nr:TetR/AcrR family transcriptional regulator [Paraburkholderia silviterrae]TDG20031.1 TetR/AcrR family transcriptional regulator [Paraburkholderia silviterrae]